MDYKIGSLADLISGANTAKKEVQKIVIPQQKFEKTKISLGKNKRKKLRRLNEKKIKDTIGKANNISEDNESDEEKQEASSDTKEKSEVAVEDTSKRTIFVGNLPHSTKKLQLKKLFIKYGEIQSVRFRNAPVADPKTSKKVAIIKQEFHPKRTNINAFVCFKTEESANKALEANGLVIEEHHLRVDLATNEKGLHDNTKAIFVGNLDFSTEEDHLWSAFKDCGNIESVRIVRDKRTSMGKGFGYVNFSATDAVELALKLDGTQIKERAVRIKRIQPNQNKKPSQESSKQPYNIKKRDKFGNKVRDRTNRNLKRKSLQDEFHNTNKKVKIEKDSTVRTVFEGRKSDKKKKKSVNKGDLMKKKMVKRLAPKAKE
uniref:Putative rna-binding protein 34 n=1 Tax=Xenopsylla cheopis TaxID=163159 RepID=A0A6M2DMJ6_XENCH